MLDERALQRAARVVARCIEEDQNGDDASRWAIQIMGAVIGSVRPGDIGDELADSMAELLDTRLIVAGTARG